MSITYTYNPNWIDRDTQPDGSALRVVKAEDFKREWESIQTAFTLAAPTADASLTGSTSIEHLTVLNSVSATGTITGSNINATNWDTAYGWGDHGAVGYALASDVPTISGYNKSNWDTAYGWGNHASAGYALASNVPTKTGSGASGTWGINITGSSAACSGNSATATTANNALACSGNAATATTADAAYQAGTATNCSRSVVAGTNLAGGGALTANRTISLVSEPSLTSVVLGNWKIFDSGTVLYFQYNGNNVFKIDSSGNATAEGDVTAIGSV